MNNIIDSEVDSVKQKLMLNKDKGLNSCAIFYVCLRGKTQLILRTSKTWVLVSSCVTSVVERDVERVFSQYRSVFYNTDTDLWYIT
jgi:hypothetical protein